MLYRLSYAHHHRPLALPTDPRRPVNGAPGRTRTYDPRLRRPMLYPAELRALDAAGQRSSGRNLGPGRAGRGGRGRGIRTPDPLLPKQVRYQTAPYPAAVRLAPPARTRIRPSAAMSCRRDRPRARPGPAQARRGCGPPPRIPLPAGRPPVPRSAARSRPPPAPEATAGGGVARSSRKLERPGPRRAGQRRWNTASGSASRRPSTAPARRSADAQSAAARRSRSRWRFTLPASSCSTASASGVLKSSFHRLPEPVLERPDRSRGRDRGRGVRRARETAERTIETPERLLRLSEARRRMIERASIVARQQVVADHLAGVTGEDLPDGEEVAE